jgi:hypothetical protein
MLIVVYVSEKKHATKKATTCVKTCDIYPPIYIGGIKCVLLSVGKKMLKNVKRL